MSAERPVSHWLVVNEQLWLGKKGFEEPVDAELLCYAPSSFVTGAAPEKQAVAVCSALFDPIDVWR